MKKSIVLFAGALAMSVSLQSEAVVKLKATTTGYRYNFNQSFVLPLNDLGETQLKFNLPKAKTLLLTFSANCAIGTGGGTAPAVQIDIIVNGSAVPPTSGDMDQFCGASSVGAPLETITLAISGKKGANTIQVIARVKLATQPSTVFGYSSLVVSD